MMLYAYTKKELQLAKRKGKKNKNKQRSSGIYFTSCPEQISKIANQVFGSSYFTVSQKNKHF
jgi:hypothetical protein